MGTIFGRAGSLGVKAGMRELTSARTPRTPRGSLSVRWRMSGRGELGVGRSSHEGSIVRGQAGVSVRTFLAR